jgi:hypothetical protein
MMRKGFIMLIGLAVLVFALAGCAPKTKTAPRLRPRPPARRTRRTPAQARGSGEAQPSVDLEPDVS